MRQLTPKGQQHVALAQRYGVSTEAVLTLLQALVSGHGTMAQFDHPELGGRGQWMSGGMVMVGDMFNQALKATVDGLCLNLAFSSSSLPTSCRCACPQSMQSQERHTSRGEACVQQPIATRQPQGAG